MTSGHVYSSEPQTPKYTETKQ